MKNSRAPSGVPYPLWHATGGTAAGHAAGGRAATVGREPFCACAIASLVPQPLSLAQGCCGVSKQPYVQFTPDGQSLALHSPFVTPPTLVLWDIARSLRSPTTTVNRRGAQVRAHAGVKGLELKTGPVTAMAFDGDWRHLVVATDGVQLWDIQNNAVRYWLCCDRVHREKPSCGHF